MFMNFISKLLGKNEDAENAEVTANEQTTESPLKTLLDMEGFVEYIVKSLVDSPDEVKVNTEEEQGGVVIKVSCRKEDIGKIVGKSGKTIRAIRSLVSGAAGRQHKRISVEILD